MFEEVSYIETASEVEMQSVQPSVPVRTSIQEVKAQLEIEKNSVQQLSQLPDQKERNEHYNILKSSVQCLQYHLQYNKSDIMKYQISLKEKKE